jgi:tetratricopeptide (TPR) repeat protein
MKPSILRRARRHTLSLAVAAALGATALPAHAQFGSLLGSIMQMQQQSQAQEAAQKAVEQAAMEANPVKKWAPARPVAADVQQAADAFAARMPSAALRPLFARLFIEGERNATLNFQRIGMAALASGELEIAEKAFEAAVVRIDLIYADNAEAQKAKSVWTAEKIKDFKGEPYERAMAHFYRGLVYAARGDFQNARAMFKQADYQDTVAESEKYAGDFALMPYMAGWASYCDGNAGMAKDFLQQAIKGDASYSAAAVEQPLLVLFETGRAPFKYGGGKHGEALKWQPHPLPEQTVQSACMDANGAQCVTERMMQAADVGFQATTRGGRQIDAVLNGKASFKEGAQGVADVAGTVGQIGLQTAMLTGNRDAAGLGMLGMFAGMIAQSASNAAQTQADIREWEQLPGSVWLGTAASKAEASQLAVKVSTQGQAAFLQARRLVNTPSCQLYWGRSLEPLPLVRDAGPVESGEHARDPVFRQEIVATFAG